VALDPTLQPALAHLRDRLAHRQLLVMVGAGASRWAGLPIWTRLEDMGVQPRAWFLELGDSSDLDIAWCRGHRIRRLDLHAGDWSRPAELVEFLAALTA